MSEKLRKGMSLEEVQRQLRRWRWQVNNVILSADRRHLFHTWDFTPPRGPPHKSLRMTFDNGQLLLWGDPADEKPERSSQTA